jgi:hypothetical protein
MSDKDTNEFEDLEDFEELEDDEWPEESEYMPEQPPGWGKALAWATIAVGGLYILNPTGGIIELIMDNFPIVGNLDEAAILFLMFGAMRYLGMRLPDFIERWTQPVAQLPGPRDDNSR